MGLTDQDILAIIAQGITDGTDLDTTAETQAREVLRQLRAAGVIVGADAMQEEVYRQPLYSRRKLVAQVAAVTALANELSWDKKTRAISERIRACLEAPQCPQ